jgi:hypothetical protein
MLCESDVVPKSWKDVAMIGLRVVVEKHPDGYVAYPFGIKGVVFLV